MTRHIDEIIVHCSATPPSMDIGADEIRDWHVNGNGWSDIGYHYVIQRSGLIESGRHEFRAGAHVKGHNDSTIGICLVGGVNEAGQPDANFTLAQYTSLKELVESLGLKYGGLKLSGHRDYTKLKACPCFDVNGLMEHA